MELECVTCGEPTSIHCSHPECIWTLCTAEGCGWIYSPDGVIPTWERYSREFKG